MEIDPNGFVIAVAASALFGFFFGYLAGRDDGKESERRAKANDGTQEVGDA